jgi:hypothetical protein
VGIGNEEVVMVGHGEVPRQKVRISGRAHRDAPLQLFLPQILSREMIFANFI